MVGFFEYHLLNSIISIILGCRWLFQLNKLNRFPRYSDSFNSFARSRIKEKENREKFVLFQFNFGDQQGPWKIIQHTHSHTSHLEDHREWLIIYDLVSGFSCKQAREKFPLNLEGEQVIKQPPSKKNHAIQQ